MIEHEGYETVSIALARYLYGFKLKNTSDVLSRDLHNVLEKVNAFNLHSTGPLMALNSNKELIEVGKKV